MLQYSENRCVFSKRLKLSLPRSGSLKLSGRVPKRRAGHREGPWTECAEPASQNHQETPSSGSKMLPRWDVRHWYTEIWDTPLWLAVQAAVHCNDEFVLNSFRHIEPMKLRVQEPRQTSVVLVSTGKHTSSSIHYPVQPVSDHFRRKVGPLMVSTPILLVITWIATHLPTPEGWKAELD